MFRKMIVGTALVISATCFPAGTAASPPVVAASDVATAMNFLESLGRLDFGAVASFLDEDVVLDLPYANGGMTVRGRAEVLQFLRQSMSRSVSSIVYKLDQAYPSVEAGATVLEISTQGRTAAGREYTNRLVGIFIFRGGKIVLFREYFNSAKAG